MTNHTGVRTEEEDAGFRLRDILVVVGLCVAAALVCGWIMKEVFLVPIEEGVRHFPSRF